MADVEVLSKGPFSLGEGSMWDARTGAWSWVDIEGKAWQHLSAEGELRQYSLSGMPGTAVLTTDPNQVLLAMDTALALLDLNSGMERMVAAFPEDAATMRFNDGKVDPQGRLWVGSMDREAAEDGGTLYRVGSDWNLVPVLPDVTISNGLCWSATGDQMYYIDSPTRVVVAFDFDGVTGSLSNRRTVVQIPDGWGYPDGMTIDANDRLWVAHWDGNCVASYDVSSGEPLQRLEIPAEKVTSCWFGGADVDTLMVTTALGSADGGWADRKTYPLSGAILTLQPGVSGRPANFFELP